ncbi:predicted protein [Uncinocarpus reesii 1704]|uniref:Uncharacterized protein n=1 Tax=Uncinocarpus reesii (strain UAMH 1704) TaxID=336963 RepID=C4JX83_UNCRE|nr:uncharacterized protein UREG_06256 [Uncinocarpus reesii 1704]EEP81391.1 predicted protein [Uncinocarpus reesii 1704]
MASSKLRRIACPYGVPGTRLMTGIMRGSLSNFPVLGFSNRHSPSQRVQARKLRYSDSSVVWLVKCGRLLLDHGLLIRL